MREYCHKIFVLVMAIAMSMPSCAQSTITENDSATLSPLKPLKMIMAMPDKNNTKVIKRYNRYRHRSPSIFTTRPMASGYTAVFGVKKNSIMSTDDIEVNFVKKWMQDPVYSDMDNRMYFVEIHNKTDQTIYIDKANCFRVYHNGARYRYHSTNENDTISTPRIIAIPPHAKKNLCEYDVVVTEKENTYYPKLKVNDYPEDFHWDARTAGINQGYLRMFEVKSFSEDNSPYYRTYLITYSKESDFSTYTLLPINFYMRQLIGYYYPELYKGVLGDFERLGGDEYTITNAELAFDYIKKRW